MNGYELIRSVGKGSYGEVTLVRRRTNGSANRQKQYVMKSMSLAKCSKKERSSAEQEAKLLATLRHPNIVAYRDSFETSDGHLHIVMDFCEGGDLYTILKERNGEALKEQTLIEWFVQIAMALQYMHEKNILHRDLKTQNIFLTRNKIIKVGDLGIAKVLENSTDMATTLIGTPYYMSPEIFKNIPYNHKSDVWALGCCVYEMATLRHAFNGKDMNSLVYRILKGKKPAMPKEYSPDLVELIKAMLNMEPSKRPSVNKIFRNEFIKRHIEVFLNNARKTRKLSTASSQSDQGSRPNSGEPKTPVKKSPVDPSTPPVRPSRGAVSQQQSKLFVPEPNLPNSSISSVSKIEIDMEVETSGADVTRKNPPPEESAIVVGGRDSSARIRHRRKIEADRKKLSTPPRQDIKKKETPKRSAELKHKRPSASKEGTTQAQDEDSDMTTFVSALDSTLNLGGKHLVAGQRPASAESRDSVDATSRDDDDTLKQSKPTQPSTPKQAAMPGAQTLSSSMRLVDRITTLRKDIIRGVGVDNMKRAYDILEITDEDDELEAQLKELLGIQDFNEYAGKIWQLKYCEDALYTLQPSAVP